MKELFEKLFHTNYDTFWQVFTDKIFGPTGAEILAWLCLAVGTFLLFARRVAAAGLIVFFYLAAIFFAYMPAIIKLLRG